MKTIDALKIAGIVGAGVVAYWAVTNIVKKGAAGAGKAAGEAVANAAGGIIKGIGSGVGIPDTDLTQCNADLAAGRYWDASFSCPLPVYTKALINKAIGKEAVNPSNVKTQAPGLTGADADKVRETERQYLRRMEVGYKDYSNPLAGIETQQFDQMGNSTGINFKD